MRVVAIALAAAGAVTLLSASIPANAQVVVKKETVVRHPARPVVVVRKWHPWHHHHHVTTTERVKTVR